MYTTAELELVIPVKYALGKNVKISSVPGSNGIDAPVLVTTAVFPVAPAASLPTPKNTVTVPELRMRYWLPPSVVDIACTGVGGVVITAVKVTVLPEGVNGALTLMLSPKVV